MVKINIYRSLLPSDRVIGWDMKMMCRSEFKCKFYKHLGSPNLATIAKFDEIVKIGSCTQLLIHWPLGDVTIISKVSFLKLILKNSSLSTGCEIAFRCMSQNLTNVKSTIGSGNGLVTSYLMLSYDVTKPQWVKLCQWIKKIMENLQISVSICISWKIFWLEWTMFTRLQSVNERQHSWLLQNSTHNAKLIN